jgi:excinuclease ABC subunit A
MEPASAHRFSKSKWEENPVHEVLEMTSAEAITFFKPLDPKKKIITPLELLGEVGLDYLRLGQPVNALSGGESQRLKLVHHLIRQSREKALLIFDEPTTGLHFDDVALLIKVFHRLVEEGNSVIVIEHNLEVIKCADWVIDLGPEGGERGGQIVAAGTPSKSPPMRIRSQENSSNPSSPAGARC